MIGSKKKPVPSNKIGGRIQTAPMVNDRIQPKAGEGFAGKYGQALLGFVVATPADIEPRREIGKNPTAVSRKHLDARVTLQHTGQDEA